MQDYLLPLENWSPYFGTNDNPKIFCNINKISMLRPLGINVTINSIYPLFIKVQLIQPNILNIDGTNPIIFILY